jgi:hypothetical protein
METKDKTAICSDCEMVDMGTFPSQPLIRNCNYHPHIVDKSVSQFLALIRREVFRARMLFPSNQGVSLALVEEVGEVAKAYLDESRDRIIEEAVQACAMVVRLALEGDPAMTKLREERGLDR